jgi:hypothetical protein
MFAAPFEVDSRWEGLGLIIAREVAWRGEIPGTLPTLEVLDHPDHPSGSSNIIPIPNARLGNLVTHIYHHDVSAGTFGANNIGSSAFNIFSVAAPQTGDFIYIGSTSGPWHNIVFNLTQLLQFTGAARWEYWDGAAWQIFNNTGGHLLFDDASGGFIGNLAATGQTQYVISLYGPSDWTANAINGVTAHWIRLNMTSVTSFTQHAVQGTIVPFTTTEPYVELPAANLNGDITALMRMIITCQGGQLPPFSSSPHLLSRVMISAKSQGLTNFISHLNLGNTTHPQGDWALQAGTDVTLNTVKNEAPTGKAALIDYGTTPADTTPRIQLKLANSAKAADYKGRYRVILKGQQIAGAVDDVDIWLGANFYFAAPLDLWTSKTVSPKKVSSGIEVFDLGQIDLPLGGFEPGVELHTINWFLYSTAASTTPDFLAYELILMPIDEWSVQLDDPLLPAPLSSGTSVLGSNFTNLANSTAVFILKTLVADGGVLLPWPRSFLLEASTAATPVAVRTSLNVSWKLMGEGAKIEPSRKTRFYFLIMAYERFKFGEEPFMADCGISASFSLAAAERWLDLRGAD